MNPRVSVVIPTYNRKAVLLESIASVQQQTFGDLQILVCDDGSTDGSREAVEALAANDPRVHWVPGAHIGFPGAVRNRGIRAAATQWVAFQDSDDLWLPQKLERQFAVLEDAPEAQFIYCHAAALLPDGSRQRMTPFRIRRQGWVFETLLMYSVVHPQTILARRSLFEEVGYFDEGMRLRIVDDYELVLRLAAKVPFHFVAEDLVLYRTQADSISADLFGSIDEYERVLNSIIARLNVPAALAREALCRIELRRYKNHLLRGYPREVRLQDLRRALHRRPDSPLGRALQLTEGLGCAGWLKRLLTAQARNNA
ncbi:MAG: glycosyltransferase [Candidatus Parcubacteria bacterium]|nr:glycosyltransferase [Burkholderiales bacterium]